MKATHTTLPTIPQIEFSDDKILVNGEAHTKSILFSPTWEMEIIDIDTPRQWLTHEKRMDCAQLLTWDNASPSPEILDLYWKKNIPVDIMTISSAIQTAKILSGDGTLYQFVILKHP